MYERPRKFQEHLLSLFEEAVENYPDLEIDFIRTPIDVWSFKDLLIRHQGVTFMIGSYLHYSSRNDIIVRSIAYLDELLAIKNEKDLIREVTEYRSFKANNMSFQQILEKALKVFDFSKEYFSPKKSSSSIEDLKRELGDIAGQYKSEIIKAKEKMPKILDLSIELPDIDDFSETIRKFQYRTPLEVEDKYWLKKAILAYQSDKCNKSALLYVLELDRERNKKYPWEI